MNSNLKLSSDCHSIDSDIVESSGAEIVDLVPIRLDAIAHEGELPASIKELCSSLNQAYPFTEESLTSLLLSYNISQSDVAVTAQFDDEKYVRIRLHESSGFEVLMLCWKHGQHTRIHDHAGSLCGVKVLQGIGSETVYTPQGRGRKVKAVKKVSIAEGSVTVSSDSDIHSLGVSESSKDQLVTLHIYSPPLTTTLPYKEFIV